MACVSSSAWRRFFLLLALLCLKTNIVFGQEFNDEMGGPTNGYASGFSEATLQYDSYNGTIDEEYWATAGSRPCSLIENYFSSAINICRDSISTDVQSGTERLYRAQREASESYFAPIGRLDILKYDGLHREPRSLNELAGGEIKSVVNDAVLFLEFVPLGIETGVVAVPSYGHNVNSHEAWRGTLRGNLFQVVDDVSGSHEPPGAVNEKSGTVDELHSELVLLAQSSTQNGDSGGLKSVDSRKEGIITASSSKASSHKKAAASDEKSDSPQSGKISLLNNGKSLGCLVSERGSGVAMTCPSIDAAGERQDTARGTSVPH